MTGIGSLFSTLAVLAQRILVALKTGFGSCRLSEHFVSTPIGSAAGSSLGCLFASILFVRTSELFVAFRSHDSNARTSIYQDSKYAQRSCAVACFNVPTCIYSCMCRNQTARRNQSLHRWTPSVSLPQPGCHFVARNEFPAVDITSGHHTQVCS